MVYTIENTQRTLTKYVCVGVTTWTASQSTSHTFQLIDESVAKLTINNSRERSEFPREHAAK